jgi:hypothetical protein
VRLRHCGKDTPHIPVAQQPRKRDALLLADAEDVVPRLHGVESARLLQQ